MIHLVVPGLLGPFPRVEQAQALPRLPALELLLARADKCAGPSSYPLTMFELFGLPAEDPVPTAPLCYYADSGGRSEARYLLHADPVYLRPDQDRLLAFDFSHSPLSAETAQIYTEAFNRHFEIVGLELLTPHPNRWYLAVDQAPDVQFQALAEVIGRNIDLFLPQGIQAAQWRVWMNEVQMLFHSLAINAERENGGEVPVSGLWFSGGGYLPEKVSKSFAGVEGDCCLLQGLDSLAGNTGVDSLIVEHTPGRAVLDGDPVAWQEAVTAFDNRLQPMMDQDLRLYTCDGQVWHWQSGMRRRWWRRIKPIYVA